MPRKPRAEAPGRPISIKLSPIERGRLSQAAIRNQQTLSAFLRDAGDAAASDCLEPEEWREPPSRRG